MPKILTREQILAAKLNTETIHVPQWGGDVVISEMPVAKRNALMAELIDKDGNAKGVTPDIELKLFIAGMHEPAFEMEDAAEMQNMSGAAVSEVAKEIMRLNGLGVEALDDAREKS